MSRKLYTTVAVARAAGVPRATLQHWIKTGKISAPSVRLVGGRGVRLWTEDQVKQVRQLKSKMKAWADPKIRARISSAAKNAARRRRRGRGESTKK